MMKFKEMNPAVHYADQLAGGGDGRVELAILFAADPADADAFVAAWTADCAFFQSQPGYVSAQLHRGIGGSGTYLDYAVFDSPAALAAITARPEFGPLRAAYPGSTTAQMHLFRRVAVPGICPGEAP